jgi:16S rRNA (cytidine1402-2'-O)-methyltransferase
MGGLYLIPTPLGDQDPSEVLTPQVLDLVQRLRHLVVENEKSARKFLKAAAPKVPQSEWVLYPMNKYTDPEALKGYLDVCTGGEDLGVLSEAGCPGIADPGADLVGFAHQKQISVYPLIGPSSILLALMGSGFNGQSFAFHGYLPIDKPERKTALKQAEKTAQNEGQTQVWIETPYRNVSLFQDLCQHLHENTLLCIACDLSLPSQWIQTKTIGLWKKAEVSFIQKRPAIFLVSGGQLKRKDFSF